MSTSTANIPNLKPNIRVSVAMVGNNIQAEDAKGEDSPMQLQDETKKDEQTTSPCNNRRKRRLSKKEQKAMKKQRKQKSGNDGNTTAKSSLSNTTKTSGNIGSNNDEGSSINYLDDYTPIPIPKNESLKDPIKHDGSNKKGKGGTSSTTTATAGGEGGDRSLGKWFPNALVIKSSVTYHNAIALHNAQSDEGITNKKKRSKKKKKGNHNNDEHKNNTEKEQKETPQQNITSVTSSSNEAPKCSLVLFYQYANPQWDHNKVSLLIRYLCDIGRERNLGGRIRVASEGVNATISCVTHSKDDHPERTIRHFAQDLINFDEGTFRQTDFKYIDGLTADRHFKELKILPVKELVYYGIREDDAPLGEGGVHLDPVEYHKMLGRDDAVVIDVRNHYEADIGRFDGQMKTVNEKRVDEVSKEKGDEEKEKINDDKDAKQDKTSSTGAEYIDPRMRKSTDFPDWLSKSSTKSKLEGKTVLMYCTGGVRCERASAYLKSQMGNEVKGVYQLKGGIEKYLQTFKDGGYWSGKNFVFDKREAIGVGNIQGDGGVIRKTAAEQQGKKKKKKSQANGGNETKGDLIQSKCCVCNAPWDRYVGKKKCYTCGVPVLMCDSCMSKKPDKTPGMELTVRCPLCISEKITVPANEVEFTANGVRNKNTDVAIASGKGHVSGKDGDVKIQEQKSTRKAAASVLKWGGGHATEKKERRKMKRKLCQFGSECVRKDCFFAHPEREGSKAVVSGIK